MQNPQQTQQQPTIRTFGLWKEEYTDFQGTVESGRCARGDNGRERRDRKDLQSVAGTGLYSHEAGLCRLPPLQVRLQVCTPASTMAINALQESSLTEIKAMLEQVMSTRQQRRVRGLARSLPVHSQVELAGFKARLHSNS